MLAVRLLPDRSNEVVPPSLAQLGTYNQGGTVFAIDIDGDSDQGLQELLEPLETFIRQHQDALVSFRSAGLIDVFIGWSPAPSQESVRFPGSLMQMLGELNAEILIDSYSNDLDDTED